MDTHTLFSEFALVVRYIIVSVIICGFFLLLSGKRVERVLGVYVGFLGVFVVVWLIYVLVRYLHFL